MATAQISMPDKISCLFYSSGGFVTTEFHILKQLLQLLVALVY